MKVYMTRSNADMTEGRGPMIPSLAFLHRAHAEEYIDQQPGVMGRKGKWSQDKYGDWDIVELNVLETPYNHTEALKQRALDKLFRNLSKEEAAILGYVK